MQTSSTPAMSHFYLPQREKPRPALFRAKVLTVKVSPPRTCDDDNDSASQTIPTLLHILKIKALLLYFHCVLWSRKCLFLLSGPVRESSLITGITVSVCTLQGAAMGNDRKSVCMGNKYKFLSQLY